MMLAIHKRLLYCALLPLALAACGPDAPPPSNTAVSPPASSVPAPSSESVAAPAVSEQNGLGQPDAQAESGTPPATPGAISPQDMAKLTLEVFNRFKTNFPQIADFSTPPVVVRVEPISGVEMFEIITPNGIFYTDKNAQWIVEGVLFIPGQSSGQAGAQATGLPTPMVNITLRPDVQRLYGDARDKESAIRSMGDEKLSGVEFFESMPRDKAVVIDYGNPSVAGGQPTREIVMMVDMDDTTTHNLFSALNKMDPASLNIRILAYPIALEEIRPYTLDRSAALLCAGFDPANPTDSGAASRVSTLWKTLLSDSSTADMPAVSWSSWAQANGVAEAAHQACPRRIEPGLFTRLVSTLGMTGTPRAVFPNGKIMVGNFTVEQLIAGLTEAPPPSTQAPSAPQAEGSLK